MTDKAVTMIPKDINPKYKFTVLYQWITDFGKNVFCASCKMTIRGRQFGYFAQKENTDPHEEAALIAEVIQKGKDLIIEVESWKEMPPQDVRKKIS